MIQRSQPVHSEPTICMPALKTGACKSGTIGQAWPRRAQTSTFATSCRHGSRCEVRSERCSPTSRVECKVAALTNDMAHWFGSDWQLKFSELSRFDLLLEAAGSGVLKPDPAVFRWALSALHERPERCLFVDDLPSNLAGARAVGMEVELFAVADPAESVRRILQRFGIKPSRGVPPRNYRPLRNGAMR